MCAADETALAKEIEVKADDWKSVVKDGSTLKEAALASGGVDEATHDKVMDPMSMVGNGASGA